MDAKIRLTPLIGLNKRFAHPNKSPNQGRSPKMY